MEYVQFIDKFTQFAYLAYFLDLICWAPDWQVYISIYQKILDESHFNKLSIHFLKLSKQMQFFIYF